MKADPLTSQLLTFQGYLGAIALIIMQTVIVWLSIFVLYVTASEYIPLHFRECDSIALLFNYSKRSGMHTCIKTLI